MFYDLHCDSLSCPLPLNRAEIFAPEETKVLAIFCEDKKESLRALECEKQYRRLTCAEGEETLTRFPFWGKRRVILGMEGASGIRSAADLADWKKRGLRMLSLCWKTNRLSSGWEAETDTGVSPEGRAFLNKMDELGMICDLSHLSENAALVSLGAVQNCLASHSNFAAVFPHKRNIPQRVADALFDKGGVVGLVPYPPFVGGGIKGLIGHAAYGLKRYGKRFLAVGTDTDGTRGVFCPELQGKHPLLPQLFSAFSNAFGKKTAYRFCHENAAEFFETTFKE